MATSSATSLDDGAAAVRLAQLRQLIQARRSTQTASPVTCKFFSRGFCQRSSLCPFSHVARGAAPRSKVYERPVTEISGASPENRLHALKSLLNAHQCTVRKNPFKIVVKTTTKSMSWVRQGFKAYHPVRSSQPAPPISRALIVGGIRFHLSNCGRTLVRSDLINDVKLTPKVDKKLFVPSRVQLNGIEFIKSSTGSLVRSTLRSSRQTASLRLKRSLQFVRNKKLDKRKQQFCMFFCRFGFCKLEKTCPFIHDKSKVAVCREFISNGCCSSLETCLLSHTIDRNKMPVCSHFLKGICAKGDHCPYRHVKVSESAAVCQHFVRGYCPKGLECKLKHIYMSRRKEDESSSAAGLNGSSHSDRQNDGCL